MWKCVMQNSNASREKSRIIPKMFRLSFVTLSLHGYNNCKTVNVLGRLCDFELITETTAFWPVSILHLFSWLTMLLVCPFQAVHKASQAARWKSLWKSHVNSSDTISQLLSIADFGFKRGTKPNTMPDIILHSSSDRAPVWLPIYDIAINSCSRRVRLHNTMVFSASPHVMNDKQRFWTKV